MVLQQSCSAAMPAKCHILFQSTVVQPALPQLRTRFQVVRPMLSMTGEDGPAQPWHGAISRQRAQPPPSSQTPIKTIDTDDKCKQLFCLSSTQKPLKRTAYRFVCGHYANAVRQCTLVKLLSRCIDRAAVCLPHIENLLAVGSSLHHTQHGSHSAANGRAVADPQLGIQAAENGAAEAGGDHGSKGKPVTEQDRNRRRPYVDVASAHWYCVAGIAGYWQD
jgi:hypothetical protein